MISVEKVSCAYKEKSILENISLQIENHVSILGENGAGKSTFAKLLCRLQAYKGEIHIDGKNLEQFSLRDLAKTIAYVPAKLEIYDTTISVEEFVLLGRFAYKERFFAYSQEDRKKVQEGLALLHLEHLSGVSMGTLSSGQTQLVLIAQALAQESKIIIFDEPTANLDPKNSKIIGMYMKQLQEKHQIIVITHDLHLARFINAPVLFVQEKGIRLEEDFFKSTKLSELYGVDFEDLAVVYA